MLKLTILRLFEASDGEKEHYFFECNGLSSLSVRPWRDTEGEWNNFILPLLCLSGYAETKGARGTPLGEWRSQEGRGGLAWLAYLRAFA